MNEANEMAKNGGVVGASLVLDGKVIVSACNDPVDPTGHAEMIVLRKGAELLGSWDALSKAVVYTTRFPCWMCAGSMWHSGIKLVIYRDANPAFKADRSYFIHRNMSINKYEYHELS